MPELPEVETIVQDLDKKLKNNIISEIQVLNKKSLNLPAAKLKSLIGRKIKNVRRRAKMIIIELSKDFLVIHLKMTGQLVYKADHKIIAGGHPISGVGRELPNKFTRVIFKFKNGSSLFFNDVRKFGWIKLISYGQLDVMDKNLGVEPLSSNFGLEIFKRILIRKPKTTIKQALMDQAHLVGLGNIYSDEVLFAAAVRPMRRVASLEQTEIKKIWMVIPKILNYAIKHRGTSFSDYVDAKGEVGNFIKYLKVYGREGERCKKCLGKVEKTKIGGRSAHFCPKCQK